MSSGPSQHPTPDRVISSNSSNNNNNDNDDSSGRQRGRNRRNRGNQSQQQQQRGFKGKNPDLQGHVYDVGLPNSNNDLFTKTTKEIGEYVARTIDGAGDYRLAMVDMVMPPLVEPPIPTVPAGQTEPSWAEREQYKQQYSEYIKKKEKRAQNESKIFPIILGQCSRTIRDRLEAHSDWININSISDVMALLKLIQKSMYTKSTNRHPIHALIDAETALHKFRQGEGMTNSDFLEKFKSLVDIFEHAGGDLGSSISRYREYLLPEEDENNNDDFKKAMARCRDEYIGVALIVKSDPKRYSSLMADLINSFTRGQDVYPDTISGAYDMLVNYQAPHPKARMQTQDEGMAFAQSTTDSPDVQGGRGSSGGGRGGRGSGRGGPGHSGRGTGRGSQSSGNSSRGEQNHTTTDNGNNIVNDQSSDEYSASLYDSRSADCFIQQQPLPAHRAISQRWVLADSCSSVNMVSDPTLLHDIQPADHSINVHCNAGTVSVTQQGLLGDYPARVWFNPHGIANIMSLHDITKHYRVTMDTKVKNAIILHRHDGSTIEFTPCSKGLYKYALRPGETLKDFWSMVTTVADRAQKYTQRQYKEATLARRVQNIIMRPSSREFMDTSIKHLRNCPVNKHHAQAAEDIFGPNLGSLKGKTTYRAPAHVAGHITPVPPSILEAHQQITLTTDIMYINKVVFLVTYSRALRFGTVEMLPDRQVPTIRDKLSSVFRLYNHRGFTITKLFADPEFEPLRPWFPCLDTCGADDHIPDIERYVRTVKDRTRSTYRMLPFKRIPRIVLIHLVKNVVFWLNSFPARDGVSNDISPRCIMTGQEVDYNKHVRLEFGEYVQTHEEHDNNMTDRTLGAICLGPTGSERGTHWFMCVASGARIARTRWTALPMPKEVIQRVSELGRRQGMPETLTFGDRHAREIEDNLADLEDYSDDGSYDPSESSNDDDVLSYDDSDNDDNDDGGDDNDEDDLPDLFPPPGNPHDNNSEQDPDDDSYDQYHPEEQDEDDDHQQDDEADDVEDRENTGVDGQNTGVDIENTGVEMDIENTGVDVETVYGDDDDSIDIEQPPTESEHFEQAAQAGRDAANSGDNTNRPRTRSAAHRERQAAHREHQADIEDAAEFFVYSMFQSMDPASIFELIGGDDAEEMLTFLTAQMTAKAGLKYFGQDGADAIMKELEQLLYRKVMEGSHAGDLTKEQKKAALKYLMFLKQKRCGKIKGRGCADGRKQRLYKTKEETSSPTISIEALFLTCMIDALERRCVVTCDIPGAFMHADIDELIHIKLEGELADLLIKLDPTYQQFVTIEQGKRVIYAKLNKALYGTMQASLLFWKKFKAFLTDLGFEENPYDSCVMNKLVNGKQCTVGWYVDDVKISHEEEAVVEEIVDRMQEEYGKEAPLSVHRGKVHEYLGMKIDFSNAGKVIFSMHEYIKGLLEECPEELLKAGTTKTPAASHLFETNDQAEKLDEEKAEIFHHLVAKLLYLSKRTRPDILLAVAFLTTRVRSPDTDDWKKLARCLCYLNGCKELEFTLEASTSILIHWWIDAAFAVHPDYRSHTGAAMSIGKGCPINISSKQKINTRSSTEAELVGVNDVMTFVLWVRLFLEAQGIKVVDNIVYQDNQSTMLLEKNGRQSSGKKTRHFEIRYYFIHDHIKRGTTRVEYCPTELMVGDFHTKPLQGSAFRRLRALIMNLPYDMSVDPAVDSQECVGASTPGQSDRMYESVHVAQSCSRPRNTKVSWSDVVRGSRPPKKESPNNPSKLTLLS